MAVFGLIGIILFFALIFGPQYWVRRTMQKHMKDRNDFPGTGGELARHLLNRAGLTDVKVEQTDFLNDHYSTTKKAVRLSKENHEGRSITAIAVAAHEVGHALQDRDGYWPLITRQRLMQALIPVEKIGGVILFATPLVFALTRSPTVLLFEVVVALGVLSSTVVVHFFTLPTEFDASFKRALPVLQHFIAPEDMADAKSVLRAAAFTYVAGALMSLFNIARLLRVFF